MASKLETLKSNEKAAEVRAKAFAAKCKALQVSHGKAFDGRHANAKDRKNAPEIAALVEEAQQKRCANNIQKLCALLRRFLHVFPALCPAVVSGIFLSLRI
jgi:hypothetical protein